MHTSEKDTLAGEYTELSLLRHSKRLVSVNSSQVWKLIYVQPCTFRCWACTVVVCVWGFP